jgi:transposase
MEAQGKRSVGIDAGKGTMVVRIGEDTEGGTKIIRWHGKTDATGRALLKGLLRSGDVVGIEAGEPGFTIARELREKEGVKVLVLNPGNLAVIFKSHRKTDAEDALKLMRLVMRTPEAELPVVQIPEEKERRQRAIVSEDGFLTGTRTRMILRLHSVYLRAGITTLSKKDLKTADKRREAMNLLDGKAEYFVKEAERLERLLAPVEEELAELKSNTKAELEREPLTPILMSMPGVGPSLALTFLSSIGNGNRFDTAAQVSNFVGFVPRLYISGKSVKLGHITKCGNTHLRRVAVQAAWALVRAKEGGYLKQKYQDLRERRGKKIAIVAVARKMIEIMWVLARNQVLYKYATPEMLKRKYNFYKLGNKGSVA